MGFMEGLGIQGQIEWGEAGSATEFEGMKACGAWVLAVAV